MLVFMPRTWPLRNDGVAPGSDAEWLPRNCPKCGAWAVVGHGRRWRSAHDGQHGLIQVRRALCRRCGGAITVLPAWALPGTHYSLAARAQAVQRYIESQASLETCAPDTQTGRMADPHTLRRWFRRRLVSWWYCGMQPLLLLPTILAWDCFAVLPILVPEVRAP